MKYPFSWNTTISVCTILLGLYLSIYGQRISEIADAVIIRSEDGPIITTQQEPTHETIAVRRGTTFDVSLLSDPDLSFEWSLAKIDQCFVKAISHLVQASYDSSPETIEQEDRWTFRASGRKPAKTQLVFHLKRPWEESTNQETLTPEAVHIVEVIIR